MSGQFGPTPAGLRSPVSRCGHGLKPNMPAGAGRAASVHVRPPWQFLDYLGRVSARPTAADGGGRGTHLVRSGELFVPNEAAACPGTSACGGYLAEGVRQFSRASDMGE